LYFDYLHIVMDKLTPTICLYDMLFSDASEVFLDRQVWQVSMLHQIMFCNTKIMSWLIAQGQPSTAQGDCSIVAAKAPTDDAPTLPAPKKAAEKREATPDVADKARETGDMDMAENLVSLREEINSMVSNADGQITACFRHIEALEGKLKAFQAQVDAVSKALDGLLRHGNPQAVNKNSPLLVAGVDKGGGEGLLRHEAQQTTSDKAKNGFQEYDIVQVHGLINAAHLNGKVGMVINFVSGRNRYAVEIDSKIVCIQAANLVFAEENEYADGVVDEDEDEDDDGHNGSNSE
jgi:hypothetical protein